MGSSTWKKKGVVNSMYGWIGTVLRVDLTTGAIGTEPINLEFINGYIGQRGLAAKYCVEECGQDPDPLGPDNKLVVMTGPMTGLFGVCTNRYEIATISPFTGCLSGGGGGGHFGVELKFAGYDGIIVQGQAAEPSYLYISDDTVQLKSAGELWGKTISETSRWITGHFGQRSRFCGIGPVSERLSPLGCVIGDGLYTIAGNGGIGAVMGAKKLKSIIVHGTGSIRVSEPDNYLHAALEGRRALLDTPFSISLGSSTVETMTDMLTNIGSRPLAEYRRGSGNADWSGSRGTDAVCCEILRRHACFSCPVGCHRVMRVTNSTCTEIMEGPEYEFAQAFGACDTDRLDILLRAFALCREYGMDPRAFGAAAACARKLAELGVFTEDEVEAGSLLASGDGEMLLRLIELAGEGTGLGAKLALGAGCLAEHFGHSELIHQASHVDKRLKPWLDAEVNGRAVYGFTPDLEGDSPMAIERSLDRTAFLEACGICPFGAPAMTMERVAASLSAATGTDFTPEDGYNIGQRIRELEQSAGKNHTRTCRLGRGD